MLLILLKSTLDAQNIKYYYQALFFYLPFFFNFSKERRNRYVLITILNKIGFLNCQSVEASHSFSLEWACLYYLFCYF